MKKVYVVVAVVAVLGIAAVSYSMNSGTGSMATGPVELPEMEDAELVAMAQGLAMGDESARVTIIEFGDYQCPGCGYFATVVKPQIEATYVETGQARFVYYDFPIVGGHPNAFLAARAARCAADQGAGWEYHDALFAAQTEWSPAANPAGRFVNYAGSVGLDEGAFEECLESDRHAALVTANMHLGQRYGVGGTPTVAVNDGSGTTQRVTLGPGVDPWTAISELVDSILAESGGDAEPATGDAGGDTGGGDG